MTKKKAVGRDPLSETDIMSEFYKPSKEESNKKEMGTSKAESQQDTKSSKSDMGIRHQEKVKATFYLTQENVISLDEIKLKILKKEGEKVNKSELVNTAINMLKHQYRE